MKRYANIWPDVIDIENGIQSIIEGTRFKRGQHEVQRLLYSAEDAEKDKSLWHRVDERKAKVYAEQLCTELKEKTWKHKKPRYRRQFCQNRASSKEDYQQCG